MLALAVVSLGAVGKGSSSIVVPPNPLCKASATADLPCAPEHESFVTPQAVCPEENFRKALQQVAELIPGSLRRAGGADAVVSNYLKIKRDAAFECIDKPTCGENIPEGKPCRWPLSKRTVASVNASNPEAIGEGGLLVNLGEGSTGTRFLTCVFSNLGLSTAHNLQASHDPYCMGKKDCTAAWDEYDYVNDWPVPDIATALMASHKGQSLAGVLLSLRDPLEWRKKRYGEHKADGSAAWQAAAPCSPTSAHLGDDSNNWDLSKLTYDAWAACIANDGRKGEHLFAFNLWAYADEATQFPKELHQFLSTRGKWAIKSLTLVEVQGAYNRCLEMGITKESEWLDEFWYKVPMGNLTIPSNFTALKTLKAS